MIPLFQTDLFEPPVIERKAEVPADAIFFYAGRPLRIIRTYGTGKDAPVIVEELARFGTCLKGQFAIWSADAVSRIMAGMAATGRFT